jgi:site-specific DNA recombinase
MIAAIYARRSDDQNDRAEDAKSITRQVERGQAFAQTRGWIVAESHVFRDDAIRGAEFAKRDGFMRVLNSLKPRPSFDVLIISELSRLGREQFETGYAMKQLSQAGVRIVSYLDGREVQLETPIDKFVIAAQNFAAEMESAKARQRVTDAMTRKAARGHALGSDCFGYRSVEVMTGDGRRSHVDRKIEESEAVVVRRIFDMCGAGYGMKRIAKTLNAEHLPAPRPRQGRPRGWTSSTIRTMLFRELYRGKYIWNMRRQTDMWGQRKSQRRPEAEWIRADVPHLRIVSEAQWNAAHARLTASRQTFLKSTKGLSWGRPPSAVYSKYLLTGLLRCGCCGGSMTIRSGKHGRVQRQFYMCGTYRDRGSAICANSLRLPLEATDEATLSKFAAYLLNPSIIQGAIKDALVELRPSNSALANRRTELLADLRRVVDEQANLASAIAVTGKVEALAEALQDRERQRARLRGELDTLERVERLATVNSSEMEVRIQKRLADWREFLHRQVPLARQAVLELLDGRIDCTPLAGERQYSLRGRVKFDGIFDTAVLAEGVVPVRGFEPRSRG